MSHSKQLFPWFGGRGGATACLAIGLLCIFLPRVRAQETNSAEASRPQRVLLIFSEARDLPGNVLMEQSVRAQITKSASSRIEFFSESIDSGHFPNPKHYRIFRDYIKNKYSGQELSLVMLFLGRDFTLTRELPNALFTNVPSIFVVVNDLDLPEPPGGRPFTGIFQRFDVHGTIEFIFELQPETRHVVVVNGTSIADQAVLTRIQETASSLAGVTFDYWTNRPIADVYEAARSLPNGTVILVGSVQRDVNREPLYTSQVVQELAQTATAPIYVLGEGSIGSGAVGGHVVDLEALGTSSGEVASRVLAGAPVGKIPVEIKSNGVPMVDWRALQRWHIPPSRLPDGCIIRYKPQSVWENHWELILLIIVGFLAQAVTIAALLLQRKRQQRAEAEILRQRTELTHVSRVSMLGQLASALTHELNQPLGAILRNAEAAEVYLQRPQPDLKEVRAILTDIKRDDKRAGNVIDGMRSLFKRQKLTLGTLDLHALVEDTVAMARPDAAARHVKLKVEIQPHLPTANGDRVHVQQVLLNLILNAMDAMNTVSKSKRTLVIRVTETPSGNLKVIVKDRGIGIEPDNAKHVFEPFFTTKSNGMGMGLAISKTIIEAHGGDIWMHSNAMDGTTFTFILPMAGNEKVKAGDLPDLG